MPNIEEFTTDDLKQAIRQRSAKGRFGIGFADVYVKQVADCFACEGLCPTDVFDLGEDAWKSAVKDASEKFAYSNDELAIYEKSIKTGDIVEGACAEFECVITSKKKDRDRDILLPKGATPDPKMPLLWQHMPPMPIGKLLEITTHNAAKVSGSFAIIDNPLGRDAAQLAEFGALRISHGFLPFKFKPLPDSDETDLGEGFEISEFEIMETSLVSIPSNTDAVLTAFSRGKLAHPAVKNWAKQLDSDRSHFWKGFDVESFEKESCSCNDKSKTTLTIDVEVNPDSIEAAKEQIEQLYKSPYAVLTKLGDYETIVTFASKEELDEHLKSQSEETGEKTNEGIEPFLSRFVGSINSEEAIQELTQAKAAIEAVLESIRTRELETACEELIGR